MKMCMERGRDGGWGKVVIKLTEILMRIRNLKFVYRSTYQLSVLHNIQVVTFIYLDYIFIVHGDILLIK